MGWCINNFCVGSDKVICIDIDSLDVSLITIIDSCIVTICYGNKRFKINKAKKYIRDFLDKVSLERKEGAIAEFFLHLYLINNNFNQKSVFRNLEENKSFKKGFDGVYTDENDEVWYMESKAGSRCTHKDKVELAYRDLKSKFEGNVDNDPWLNAYAHVQMVDADKSLMDKFEQFSDDFDNNISHDIREFNIMPSGTILDNTGTCYKYKEISDGVFNYFRGRDYGNLIAICVTQRALNDFEDYLKR